MFVILDEVLKELEAIDPPGVFVAEKSRLT